MTRLTGLRILLVEWMAFGLVMTIIIGLQSVFEKYGDDAVYAWFFLANGLVPPLALLMSSVLSDDAKKWGGKPANMFRLYAAIVISTLFLMFMLGGLLLEPVFPTTSFTMFDAANYGMGVWLGVVFVAISAVLFDGR
jgi:hypothetical protein